MRSTGVIRVILGGAVALFAWGARTSRADVELITNGDFEDGGGSFTGWTTLDEPGGTGAWFIQTGTGSPLNGFVVPAPPGPTNAAMTDQGGPGSHVLLQSIVIPATVGQATLSFERYILNSAGDFITLDSLSSAGDANQQARIDIITSTADPFSVAAADVLLNIFQTQPGDPFESGYTLQTADLTSLFASMAGQTVVLRFAEADNQLFFNFGIDLVSLTVSETASAPEPSSVALLCLGSLGVPWIFRRRQLARKAA
jgi:PEP-CTERM motif